MSLVMTANVILATEMSIKSKGEPAGGWMKESNEI